MCIRDSYDEGQRERLARALKAEKYSEADHSGIYTLDIPVSYTHLNVQIGTVASSKAEYSN